MNRTVGDGGQVIPGRSLGAWDHLASRRWGACCPSLGWALLLRSEIKQGQKKVMQCAVVCFFSCVLPLIYRNVYIHDALDTKLLQGAVSALTITANPPSPTHHHLSPISSLMVNSEKCLLLQPLNCSLISVLERAQH